MRFKIGVTFTGTHRSRVRSIVSALLTLGFSKDEIFFDEWHDALINGIDADIELRNIYANSCDLVVVCLAKDYNTKPWTRGVEWRAIRQIINVIKGKKICLLNIDGVDINAIDGLSSFTDIAKKIELLSDDEVAEFIKKRYEFTTANTVTAHKKTKNQTPLWAEDQTTQKQKKSSEAISNSEKETLINIIINIIKNIWFQVTIAVSFIASIITIATCKAPPTPSPSSTLTPTATATISQTTTELPEDEPLVDKAFAYVTFFLNSLSERDAAFASELLESRVQTFVGKENYTYTVEYNSVDVSFPIELLEDMNLIDFIKSMVSRPTELYILSDVTIMPPLAFPKFYKIERNQILDAKPASCDYTVVAHLGLELNTKNPIECVEITFMTETANIIRQYITEYGNTAAFAMDYEYISNGCYYWRYILASEKKDSFYLLCLNGQNKRYANLIAYNLTHACMPGPIQFDYSKTYPPAWEDPKTTANTGNLQVSEKDIAGQAVQVKFACSEYSDPMSAGAFLDMVSVLKFRLDAIGSPYAFGYGTENPKDLYILTSVERMGPDIINLLIAERYKIALRLPYYQICDIGNVESFICSEQKDGNYRVDVTLTDEMNEQIHNALEEDNMDQSPMICLSVNEKPLLFADLSLPFNNEISFKRIAYDNRHQISRDYEVFIRLLDAVVNGPRLPYGRAFYQYGGCEFRPADSGAVEFGFSGVTVEEQRITKIIHAIDDSIEVSFPAFVPGTIYISLGEEINDNLPHRAVSLIENIYAACEFYKNFYPSVYFIITDEQGGERCRVCFNKYIFHDTIVLVSIASFEERIAPVMKQIQSIIQESAFFGEGFDFDF